MRSLAVGGGGGILFKRTSAHEVNDQVNRKPTDMKNPRNALLFPLMAALFLSAPEVSFPLAKVTARSKSPLILLTPPILYRDWGKKGSRLSFQGTLLREGSLLEYGSWRERTAPPPSWRFRNRPAYRSLGFEPGCRRSASGLVQPMTKGLDNHETDGWCRRGRVLLLRAAPAGRGPQARSAHLTFPCLSVYKGR